MSFKLPYLLLFLLLAFIAPQVISARDVIHIHKSSRLLFPQHLEGSRKGNNIEGIRDVKVYLQRYGYYLSNVETNSNSNSHDDAFDDMLESAVKGYQKNFKLNASGILDADTLDQMSKPRCGVADEFMDSNGEPQMNINSSHFTFFGRNRKWPPMKYHLTYGFIHNYPPKFVAPVVRALEAWDSNTIFSFSQAARVQSADIVLSFERRKHGDRFPFDGRGGTLAHAFGPRDGRVHFDADEDWGIGAVVGGFDVQTIALHELGHVLGLGHTTVEEAIMWPSMDSGVVKRLHADDIAGIRALYYP